MVENRADFISRTVRHPAETLLGIRSVKKSIYWLVLVFILYALLEGSSLFGLMALRKIRPSLASFILTDSISDKDAKIIRKLLNDETNYVTYSARFGWTIKKNGFSDMYRANSQGIRADVDYTAFPANGIVRIASFGDSFTHCDEVRNADTWQEKLRQFNGNLEDLNFGVGGIGLDQAFLRYETDGIDFHPDIVLIGFMPENICRHVNVYRPFYSPNTNTPLAKPRFTISDSRLAMVENPMSELTKYDELLQHPEIVLPQLGRNDYFYQSPAYYKNGPIDFLSSVRLIKTVVCQCRRLAGKHSTIITGGYYNTKSEAYQLTLMILDEFVRSAPNRGSVPIIVVLPDRVDIVRYRRDGKRKYDPLIKEFEKSGYEYIDLMHAFDTHAEDIRIDDIVHSHYTPLANELVARYLDEYLKERHLLDPGEIRQVLQDAGSKIERAENLPSNHS